MTTSIVLDKLSKRFGAGAPAVDSVSLRIEAGELFFLLGPSGCGKTTLLRMVAGFIEPTAGTVVFEQPSVGGGAPVRRDVTSLPPNKRNTGMVFQSYALWPHMSVEANVGFGLSVRGVSADEKRRRVGEALELVRMSEYAARKPNQLSGGQQQRVALARALVIRPDVLLLDEPLSNLDAKLRIELRTEIRRICKEARSGAGTQGMTAIYVTHDQKEALSMADRVAIMRAGRVVQIGTPEQLYRDPGSAFVAEFLGETNFIPGTVEAGAGPGQVRVRTPAGSLTGRAPAGAALGAGTRVLCSVRPESIRAESAAPGPNLLAGSVSRRTYLGEMAQLDVQLRVGPGAACVPLKVSVMNPPSSPPSSLPSSAPGDRAEARAGTWGPEIALWVDPQDVVILPEPA